MSHLQQFHYQIYGEDHLPKIVFLHGLMGTSSNWRKISNQLKDQYQILTFDQRGHGRSFHPKSGFSPNDFAEDLNLILHELKWQKVFLLGHSMGGRNAISFAAQHPEKVIALVIEDIAPEGTLEGLKKIQMLLDLVPTPFKNKKAAKDFLFTEFEDKLKGDPHAHTLAQFFYTNIELKENGQADWRFSKEGILQAAKAGREINLWPEYRALNMPALVIRGDKSKDFSDLEYNQMLEQNSHVEGVVIKDAGHWVHFDQPESFIMTLKLFFSKVKEVSHL